MTTDAQELSRTLERVGLKADTLRSEARNMTVQAVVKAANEGMSQRDIAAALGRSQPEVSRLLKLSPRGFVPSSKLGQKLTSHRREILSAARSAGVTNVRVFGSVARGDDSLGSDIDLLVEIPDPFSLMDLARFQRKVESILNHRVDVVPARGLKGRVAQSALEEAVAL